MNIDYNKIAGYQHWASYFINNDATGLTELEKREADDFFIRMQREYGKEAYIADTEEGTHFGYPEYGGMFGTLTSYTVATIKTQGATK
jgi:hypothetical protein